MMKRSELEALSNAELRSLIVDAAMLLEQRAAKAAGNANANSRDAGLFQFGVPGSQSSPSSGSGLFSAAGSAGGGYPSAPTGKLFGGTGGGLFGGTVAAAAATTAPSTEANADEGCEEDENGLVKEEEVVAVHGWTPTMTLEVRESFETGEEQEEQLYCQRSKLYRFKDGEWKERGLGEAKLLKNKEGRIRFLLRQEKTGKVMANHFVIDTAPYCDLRSNADSEKIWVWTAQDVADGELQVEQLALKFGTVELAEKFKEAFNDAKAKNSEVAKREEKA